MCATDLERGQGTRGERDSQGQGRGRAGRHPEAKQSHRGRRELGEIYCTFIRSSNITPSSSDDIRTSQLKNPPPPTPDKYRAKRNYRPSTSLSRHPRLLKPLALPSAPPPPFPHPPLNNHPVLSPGVRI